MAIFITALEPALLKWSIAWLRRRGELVHVRRQGLTLTRPLSAPNLFRELQRVRNSLPLALRRGDRYLPFHSKREVEPGHLAQQFTEREAASSTILLPGLAVPHLVVEGSGRFETRAYEF